MSTHCQPRSRPETLPHRPVSASVRVQMPPRPPGHVLGLEVASKPPRGSDLLEREKRCLLGDRKLLLRPRTGCCGEEGHLKDEAAGEHQVCLRPESTHACSLM